MALPVPALIRWRGTIRLSQYRIAHCGLNHDHVWGLRKYLEAEPQCGTSCDRLTSARARARGESARARTREFYSRLCPLLEDTSQQEARRRLSSPRQTTGTSNPALVRNHFILGRNPCHDRPTPARWSSCPACLDQTHWLTTVTPGWRRF